MLRALPNIVSLQECYEPKTVLPFLQKKKKKKGERKNKTGLKQGLEKKPKKTGQWPGF